MRGKTASRPSSKQPVEELIFYRQRGRVEVEKQFGRTRFHLSWDDLESVRRDLQGFLDAKRLGLSIPDLLADVRAGNDAADFMNLGPKGTIVFTPFCNTVLPEHRQKLGGWIQEKRRVGWIADHAPFKNREMHLIRPAEIEAFFKEYCGRPEVTSDNTKGHFGKALKAIFRTAAKAGFLRRDPSTGIEIPAIPETTNRSLTFGEAIRLVHAAEAEARAWILTVLYTGLRPVEIRRLTVSSIDVGERKLTVVGQTVKNRSRSFYLHDDIFPVIRERALAIENLPLFRTPDGRPAPFPRGEFDRARKKAKLIDVPLYCLRHTFCTWLLDAGIRDNETRATLLGHRLPGMSARYSHVSWSMIQSAIQSLPSVMSAEAETVATA